MLSSAAERAPGVSVNLLQLIVIAYGAWLASRGEMSVGTLVAFNGLFLNFYMTPGRGHGYEFNLALLAMALSILIGGAGAVSIDRVFVPFGE